MKNQYAVRQGDVMLRPSVIPADAKRVKLRPAALGEATGHHHSFMSNTAIAEEDLIEMYEKDGMTYVRVLGDSGDVSLVHQEHKAHVTAPGDYAIVIQQENTDWGAKPVVD